MHNDHEVKKILAFVRQQQDRVPSQRKLKRRLAAFGFSIEETEKGPMIALLPLRRIVCALPQENCA